MLRLLWPGGMQSARIGIVAGVAWTLMAGACSEAPPSLPEGDSSGDTDDGSSSTGEPDTTTGDATNADVVYWRDIKPIVDARCGACHSADGVAPFALGTYAEVAAYGEAMQAAIDGGAMPPWPASPDCNEYMFDPSLTAAQKDAIASWVALGKPEGDPSDVGAALPVASAALPRVDFEVAMAEPHVAAPPTGEVDEHRCFLVDWPQADDRYVTGYEVVPGNRKVVHHLVARVVGPNGVADLEEEDAADPEYGWACGAGTGMQGAGGPLLGVWVPGQGANVLPAGTGMKVQAGSKVLMNMHYNTVMGDTAPDRTAIRFMVEAQVEREGESQFVTDPSWPIGDNMLIAANDADSLHEFELTLPVAMTVYASGLHMHTLARYGSLQIERKDGAAACAVDIPKWEFGWQLGYWLTEPLALEAGDRVVLRCGYDNSAGNQPIIDGEPRVPADVTWGEDTYDEMCLGFVYVTRG